MITKTRRLTLKRWSSSLCLISLGLTLAACGGSDGSKDDKTDPEPMEPENPFVQDETVEAIADDIMLATDGMTPSDSTVVYNLVWDAAFFHTIRQGFQVAAQEVGFSTDIVTVEPEGWPPTGSLPDYSAENADAYISHWAGGVYEDREVPWFAIEPGTDVEPDLYVAGVSSDNDGIGQLLSDLMMEQLDNEVGKVAVYGASDGPGYARGTSVKEILEAAGYEVVGAPDTDIADDAEKVLEVMASDFEEHADIVGVMGMLGFHGGAIGSWLEENGFEPGEIKVVSTDFEAETQEGIEKGFISATTVQRQYWWGYLAGYVGYGAAVLGQSELNSILADHADNNNVVNTKFDTVTPENAETYLEFLADIGVLE